MTILTTVTSGGVKDDSIVNADIKSDAAIAGSKLAAATTSAAGSMSAADKTKLDGVASSATAVGGATGVDFNDDVYIRLGTGNDLKIWHNAGANSYIRNESGNLLIESNGAGADAIQVVAGGAVELFHNGTKKLETTSNGITVTHTTAPAVTLVGANDTDSGIYFNDGANQGGVIYQHDGDYMSFRTSGTDDRLRIDSSGKVGIGVSPSKTLHVK